MKSRIMTRLGVIITSMVMALSVVTPAMAACNNQKTVAGLRPWYFNLDLDDDCSPTGKPSEVISTIIMNVVYDLMAVASLVALGYIIYAGYQIVLSNGDPSKYAKGKKTLSAAVIGLVICLAALAIVTFVADTLMIEH